MTRLQPASTRWDILSHQVPVRMSEAMRARLRRRAAVENVAESEVVRRAIHAYCAVVIDDLDEVELREELTMPVSETPEPIALGIAEIQQATSFGQTFIYEAIRTGELKTFKAGRRRLATRQAVVDWVDGLAEKGSDST